MPTYAWLRRFGADFDSLSRNQQAAFLVAVVHFVEDLQGRGGFRKGLRIKAVRGASGMYEMTWADDGRATFEYGDSVVAGEPHVIWRRVSTHAILDRP